MNGNHYRTYMCPRPPNAQRQGARAVAPRKNIYTGVRRGRPDSPWAFGGRIHLHQRRDGQA